MEDHLLVEIHPQVVEDYSMGSQEKDWVCPAHFGLIIEATNSVCKKT